MPQKLQWIKSPKEEFNEVLKMVWKYSIHFQGKVNFQCKKMKEMGWELNSANKTKVDIIKNFLPSNDLQFFEFNYEAEFCM